MSADVGSRPSLSVPLPRSMSGNPLPVPLSHSPDVSSGHYYSTFQAGRSNTRECMTALPITPMKPITRPLHLGLPSDQHSLIGPVLIMSVTICCSNDAQPFDLSHDFRNSIGYAAARHGHPPPLVELGLKVKSR
jgi:hypothetical protein